MTLIAVYNSEGCVGRCDARCYNATTPHCDCICGGTNHGGGLAKGLDNTRERFQEWIDRAEKERGVKLTAEVNDEVYQPSLFPT